MHLISIIPKRDYTIFEVSYQGRIVDVIYTKKGIIETENDDVKAFVEKEVVPFLPNWIGWKRKMRKR